VHAAVHGEMCRRGVVRLKQESEVRCMVVCVSGVGGGREGRGAGRGVVGWSEGMWLKGLPVWVWTGLKHCHDACVGKGSRACVVRRTTACSMQAKYRDSLVEPQHTRLHSAVVEEVWS